MNITIALNSIISLFLIMIVGIIGKRRNIITKEVSKGMIDLLLNMFLPCMIVSSFALSYDNMVKLNILKAFFFSLVTYIIIIGISILLTKPIKDGKRAIIHFSNVFTNTGYIGFPILNVVYGPEAIVYGSIFNMFFVLFLWSYGIMIFKGKVEKDKIKKEILLALRNPSVIAVYIGIMVMLFNIKVPEIVLNSIKTVGSMSVPISMIIVGAIFANVNVLKHMKDWTIYYGIIVKLILIPLILYLIKVFVGDNSMVVNSIIILASMPSAAMTSIFAENFNYKKNYATVLMVMTTLFSIISIPVFLWILI